VGRCPRVKKFKGKEEADREEESGRTKNKGRREEKRSARGGADSLSVV